MSSFFITYSAALAGGILPALVWLWFWLQEDKLHPEPKRRLMLCFIAGMVATPFVLPFEKMVADTFTNPVFIFFMWAVIEEVFKFGAAYIVAIRSVDLDEPVDGLIYMITAALGFAAAENTMFLISPISDGLIAGSIITGNLRFVGATLLHTIASATVGIFIAYSFRRGRRMMKRFVLLGLFVAVALHTVFNVSIMNDERFSVMFSFYFVWAAVILLIVVFEKIKKTNQPATVVAKKSYD